MHLLRRRRGVSYALQEALALAQRLLQLTLAYSEFFHVEEPAVHELVDAGHVVAVPVALVVVPHALVDLSARIALGSHSLAHVVLPLSGVLRTVNVLHGAVSALLVVLELTVVMRAVWLFQYSVPVSDSCAELASVHRPVLISADSVSSALVVQITAGVGLAVRSDVCPLTGPHTLNELALVPHSVRELDRADPVREPLAELPHVNGGVGELNSDLVGDDFVVLELRDPLLSVREGQRALAVPHVARPLTLVERAIGVAHDTVPGALVVAPGAGVGRSGLVALCGRVLHRSLSVPAVVRPLSGVLGLPVDHRALSVALAVLEVARVAGPGGEGERALSVHEPVRPGARVGRAVREETGPLSVGDVVSEVSLVDLSGRVREPGGPVRAPPLLEDALEDVPVAHEERPVARRQVARPLALVERPVCVLAHPVAGPLAVRKLALVVLSVRRLELAHAVPLVVLIVAAVAVRLVLRHLLGQDAVRNSRHLEWSGNIRNSYLQV